MKFKECYLILMSIIYFFLDLGDELRIANDINILIQFYLFSQVITFNQNFHEKLNKFYNINIQVATFKLSIFDIQVVPYSKSYFFLNAFNSLHITFFHH